MSRENVEIVSEGLDAFNRRDLDRYLATISPDVEWDVSEGFLGVQDVYRGWAGVRKWWNDFLEAWESFDAELDEMAEGKAGAVFVGINGKGRGRASGVETELHFLFVFWIADHKVARLRMFQSRDQALEAAGLGE
jgi:ketosteroid isomerase-like protein